MSAGSWSSPQLPLTELGVHLEELPPGNAGCPLHYHLCEEEQFYVLHGALTVRELAPDAEAVREYTSGAAISSSGPRDPHRPPVREPRSRAGPVRGDVGPPVRLEVCVYPDSGKVMMSGVGVGLFPAPDDPDTTSRRPTRGRWPGRWRSCATTSVRPMSCRRTRFRSGRWRVFSGVRCPAGRGAIGVRQPRPRAAGQPVVGAPRPPRRRGAGLRPLGAPDVAPGPGPTERPEAPGVRRPGGAGPAEPGRPGPLGRGRSRWPTTC